MLGGGGALYVVARLRHTDIEQKVVRAPTDKIC